MLNDLMNRLRLAAVRSRAYRRTTDELESYTPRELAGDLGLGSGDIPRLAAEAAALAADRYLAAHPRLAPKSAWAPRRKGYPLAAG